MPRRRVIDYEILNIQEITNFFEDYGKVPQKSVTKSARTGAELIRRKTKASSQLPIRYGFLQMGIQKFQERKQKGRRNVSGKAGFDVTFDRLYDNIFASEYKGTPRRGSKYNNDRFYYPASMEYGFANQKGGVGGHHFLQRTGVEFESPAQDAMLDVLSKEIDAIKSRR